MDLRFSPGRIELNKELNALDQFALRFTDMLQEAQIPYVIVSGYVAILFGRNRASEDIDLIVDRMNPDSFTALWQKVEPQFDCLNAPTAQEAYDDYLMTGLAIRFAKKGGVIPNIEFKFPKNDLDRWAVAHRMEIRLGSHTLYTSPLESQIAYKLFLGSEKDIEDAKFLYHLFKERLERSLLEEFVRKLNVKSLFAKYMV
ncbi:MAG: hypothetical protein HY369_02455 [Candidatus Aenigmarchaeota archaeon]|nr:hypothetical protein [Candidatus Aenigmarchaeota archaeon]